MDPLKWDGHTHSQFCRHGSSADMQDYIETALSAGFERYTVTEHPPLPDRWIADEKLMRELAMDRDELPVYIDYASRMKREFSGRIDVTVGLELDYLCGHSGFMLDLIDPYEAVLEDAVVSVHYLPGTGGMRCIDFTANDFKEGLLAYYGSMEAVVDEYYNHVELAIDWAAGLPMRKRIGHINLIEKFRTELPAIDETQVKRRLEAILPKLKKTGVGIDVNTAGLRVKTCEKPYVPEWFLKSCREANIPCVFGSDAHKPQDAGYGWDWYEERMR
jgi:histidinol-phosphatase (PHP family)